MTDLPEVGDTVRTRTNHIGTVVAVKPEHAAPIAVSSPTDNEGRPRWLRATDVVKL